MAVDGEFRCCSVSLGYRPINIRQIKSLPDYQLLGRILTRLPPPQSEAPGSFAGAVSVRCGGGVEISPAAAGELRQQEPFGLQNYRVLDQTLQEVSLQNEKIPPMVYLIPEEVRGETQRVRG